MIRTLVALSALAMTSALAVPASAETSSVVVSVVGKSPTQAYDAVVGAARDLCGSQAGDIHGLYADACVMDVVKTAMSHADFVKSAH